MAACGGDVDIIRYVSLEFLRGSEFLKKIQTNKTSRSDNAVTGVGGSCTLRLVKALDKI